MAVVMEKRLPGGGLVRVHDDCLAKDNEAARKAAYDVAAKIHWQLVREGKITPRYADEEG